MSAYTCKSGTAGITSYDSDANLLLHAFQIVVYHHRNALRRTVSETGYAPCARNPLDRRRRSGPTPHVAPA